MLGFLNNWRVVAGAAIIAAIGTMAMWPQTIDVDVARPSRGDLLVTIDEEGQTRVQRRFVVSAPVAGRLQRIELEPGDRVARGRIIARLLPAAPALLDPRTQAETAAGIEAAQAQLGQAQAERDRATAAWQRASSAVKRRKELAEAGLISRDQFESDETALKMAEEDRRAADYAVARAEQELRIARARIQQPTSGGRAVEVTAPIAGVVLKRFRESEVDVPAGDPLIEIGDPKGLEIVSDLLSSDVVRLAPGNRVLMEGWGGNEPLMGRVRRVEPSGFLKTSALGVEEQRVNVIIDFENAVGTPLGDGYRVEVHVVVAEAKDILKVPVGSLFRQDEEWAVFVIESGRARIRTIKLGRRNDLEAEVVAGLAIHEPIVLHPPDVLEEGSRVQERPSN